MKQSLIVISALSGSNAFTNYNSIPVYSTLSSCSDTQYHTDCAWNECCGYLTSCCTTRDSVGDYCDFTMADGTTAASEANIVTMIKANRFIHKLTQ